MHKGDLEDLHHELRKRITKEMRYEVPVGRLIRERPAPDSSIEESPVDTAASVEQPIVAIPVPKIIDDPMVKRFAEMNVGHTTASQQHFRQPSPPSRLFTSSAPPVMNAGAIQLLKRTEQKRLERQEENKKRWGIIKNAAPVPQGVEAVVEEPATNVGEAAGNGDEAAAQPEEVAEGAAVEEVPTPEDPAPVPAPVDLMKKASIQLAPTITK